MSKLIRRTKKNFGAALLVALQLLTLTLAGLLMPWGTASNSSQPKLRRTHKVSADQQAAPSAAADALQTATQTAQAPTASRPKSPCVLPLSTRTRSARNRAPRRYLIWRPAALPQPQHTQRTKSSEQPNEEPTLTTDREDYPPYSYVYFHGTGFQPGETVNMIVVELEPIQRRSNRGTWWPTRTANSTRAGTSSPQILLAPRCRPPLPANPPSSPRRQRSQRQAVMAP